MFVDGDILVRGNLTRLFEELDPQYALYCVQHAPLVEEGVKMDQQWNQKYHRKWWSSCFVVNCEHPANRALTIDAVNELPGRDLHRFSWLDDSDIASLGIEWNYLVGISEQPAISPRIVHFTLGIPSMAGYEDCEYAEEWRKELALWAS